MSEGIKKQSRDILAKNNEDVLGHIRTRVNAQKVECAEDRVKALQALTLFAQLDSLVADRLEAAADALDHAMEERVDLAELDKLDTFDEIRNRFELTIELEAADQALIDLDAVIKKTLVPRQLAISFYDASRGENEVIDEALAFAEVRQRVRKHESRLYRSLKILKKTGVQLDEVPLHEFLAGHPDAQRIASYNSKVGEALGASEARCFVPTHEASRAAEKFISYDQGRWELAAEQTAESAKHGREGQKAAQKTFRKKHDNKLLFLREVVRLAKVSNSKPLQDLSDLANFIQDTQNAHIRKEAAKGLGKLPSMETFAGGLIKNRERDKEVWQPIRDNLIEWIGELKAGQTSSKNVARNRQRYER